QGSDAVHRHHAQPPHHAGRGRGLRRHDAGARRVHHRGRATGPDGTGLKRVRRALRGALLLGLAVPAGGAARRLRVSPAAGITPLAPVDPVLTTITPDFSWSLDNPPPPGTTVTYRLRVARDSPLASLVVDTATDTAGGPRRPSRRRRGRSTTTSRCGAARSSSPISPSSRSAGFPTRATGRRSRSSAT